MASGGLAEVARGLSYKNVEALFRAVGEGHVAAATVAQQVVNELTEVEEETPEAEELPPPSSPIRIGQGSATTSPSRATAA
jgi:GTP diphosphokinase / guanosine-3',5'-bis(diphosphate) 3'-diphosphatase